ncbi:hypothetical protein QBC33DRAFT_567112 [Phialemonium atrogriseum]|uniref:Uncharacterized protein n=1 Tax=Phialemonium atrogriseum TaxID=1093897 RepID=A0AAJ0FS07_9PEZI|nr:uncharacterized protein QBC33DRAFT_567112 [Phialemonium atrogriseum]KAK1770685.1 hypothetical protein QBC33DRAFT_567112 [Phialemonium atrogriseum]
MPGLSSSRWAPKLGTSTYYSSISDRPPRLSTTSSTAAPASTTNPQSASNSNNATQAGTPNSRSSLDELARYTKIVRRLKWKLPHLASGYQKSVNRVGCDPAEVAEAELMFKLDFFEYYMLLERALVHLLGVFAINVSPSPRLANSRWNDGNGPANNNPDQQQQQQQQPGGNIGPATRPQRYQHRYHAKVLEALEDPANPLRSALGTGEARRQLGRAKDLRNRWKDADGGDGNGAAGGNGKMPAPLESYDIERILTAIFDGFDQAFVIAERFVRGGGGGGGVVVDGDMDMYDGDWTVTEEEQWEFMVEAMDWEAV